MTNVYIYVISHDLGFAPNPFHGICTLACCKPIIRRTAKIGDWIIGMGGAALKATGRCIYAMKVTNDMTFNEYRNSEDFRQKRPVRNGSRRSMVGDNIYYSNPETGRWFQDNSVHSLPDGNQNQDNTDHDTSTDRILISEHFIYFGDAAPEVAPEILEQLGYKNGRGHKKFEIDRCEQLLSWIDLQAEHNFNRVLGDPFEFRKSEKRYSIEKNRLI